MLQGRSLLPARRWALLVVVSLLGLSVASATAIAGPSGWRDAGATTAKKKCKKKHRSASSAKKKCKKKKAAPTPVAPVTTAPQLPQPLTDQEIRDRVSAKAAEYCSQDPNCGGLYGSLSTFPAGSAPLCSARSDFSATCGGYYGAPDMGSGEYRCEFYEVVERDGLSGIKSHLDTTFGTNGFDCFMFV